jgi:hypothetical protein
MTHVREHDACLIQMQWTWTHFAVSTRSASQDMYEVVMSHEWGSNACLGS